MDYLKEYNLAVGDFASDLMSDIWDEVEQWKEETNYDFDKLADYNIDKESLIEFAKDYVRCANVKFDFTIERFVDTFIDEGFDATDTAKRFYK